jgi:hypothetical protein
MQYIPIDFEFNTTNEAKLNLVSCSFEYDKEISEYWLYNSPRRKLELKQHLLKLREDNVFVAFNVIAEAQSFISLGINPVKCKWIDLQLEWKMMCNHWHKWAYGKQLMNGRVVTTTPPTYGGYKTVNNSKAKTNLAAFLFKTLGVKIDTDNKDEIRNLCQ